MADLRGLYQEVILDHSKRPRNLRAISDGRRAEGYNPLCGDKVTVYLKMDGDRIADVSFQGSGCAISTASASILTETLKGKPPTEQAVRAVADAIMEEIDPPSDIHADAKYRKQLAGVLEIFLGVRGRDCQPRKHLVQNGDDALLFSEKGQRNLTAFNKFF